MANADSTLDARYVSIGELSAYSGLSRQMLREYERKGILSSVRSIGGHRRYHLPSAMRQLFGEDEAGKDSPANGQPIAYARVSGNAQSKGFDHDTHKGRNGQDSDLLRQVERLKAYSLEKYGAEPVMFCDTGSGMNPDRKSFNRMLDRILNQEFKGSPLLITYRERLIRFNFQLVEKVCRFGGVKIVILDRDEDEEKDLMVEVAEDVTALIGHMHARLNGQKAARTNTKRLSKETIALAIQMHQSGEAWWKVVERLNAAGHRTANGDRITYHLLKKNVVDNLEELLPVVGSDDHTNSFEEWARGNLRRQRGAHTRLQIIHSHYAQWCRENRIEPLSPKRCSKVLRESWKLQSSNRWTGHTEFLGVVVK